MADKIRLLIVDDHPLFRQGVRFYLETVPGLELAGEVADGETALKLLAGQNVDVILMDLQMPGMNGVAVTAKIKETWPAIKS